MENPILEALEFNEENGAISFKGGKPKRSSIAGVFPEAVSPLRNIGRPLAMGMKGSFNSW